MTTFPLNDYLTGVAKVARKRTPPTERNRNIHHQVRVACRTQRDVAQEFGINQQRVSAICRQVDRWRSESNLWEVGELDGDARRTAERILFRDRTEQVVCRAFQMAAQSVQPIVTTKNGQRDGKEWDETITRTTSGSGQHLKTALAAMQLLHKLDQAPAPPRADRAANNVEYLRWIVETLARCRIEAERQGLVPKTSDPRQATAAFIGSWFGGPPLKPEMLEPAAAQRVPARSAYSEPAPAANPAAESVVAAPDDTTPDAAATYELALDEVEEPQADSLHPARQPFTTPPADCQAVSSGRAPCIAVSSGRVPCTAATSGRVASEVARDHDAPTGQPAKALGAAQGSRSAPNPQAPTGRAEPGREAAERAPLVTVADDPPARRMFRGRPLRPR